LGGGTGDIGESPRDVWIKPCILLLYFNFKNSIISLTAKKQDKYICYVNNLLLPSTTSNRRNTKMRGDAQLDGYPI